MPTLPGKDVFDRRIRPGTFATWVVSALIALGLLGFSLYALLRPPSGFAVRVAVDSPPPRQPPPSQPQAVAGPPAAPSEKTKSENKKKQHGK